MSGEAPPRLALPFAAPAWITAAALAALALAGAARPDAGAQFGWDAALAAREPWRALTAHFIHIDTRHLVANLGALLLLAWVGARRGAGAEFAGSAAAAALAVSAGIAAGPVPLAWYAGLSGILYGLFAHEALRLGRAAGPGRWVGFALHAAGLAKVVADLQLAVGTIGTLGIPIAPPAHLYGYLGGTLAALPALPRRWRDVP